MTIDLLKAESKALLELKKLSQDKFACEADAIKALSTLSKKLKYHQITDTKVSEIKPKKKITNQKYLTKFLPQYRRMKVKLTQTF
ncbi:hypothetical protein [Nostoc sp. TCL240-02]|uniref:hypothetical protein n=1 Tax=Nostoc sp. TCL240-02 TaxID=2572090 RepID=UPI0020C5D708|nr:hypothetical protein [Nostoc sp. TCL240-02]